MKSTILLFAVMLAVSASFGQSANAKQSVTTSDKRSLYMDVHELQPGKVTFSDVMNAHKKDLATEGKYDVQFLKFWVDEKGGKVYCLSSAKDSMSIIQTHKEAHGLLPTYVMKVQEGE